MQRLAILTFILSALYASSTLAEESVTERAEKLADKPTGQVTDLGIVTRRAKLTEEQAVNQLKYMTVQGWKRIEKELNERGSFKAFGLTLSPQGEFRAVHLERGDKDIPNEFEVDMLVRNLKAIADTRSVWAVGMMYVTGQRRPDGTISKRIAVIAEHIAGWAKAWSYPYKVTEDGVRIGNSKIADMDPVYFNRDQ